MSATRLPAFQFYPGDLQKDAAYKRCTKAERGAFLDFLCLVHECDFRGAAFDNGSAMTWEEVAGAIGGDQAENLALLAGLIAKGPIKVWSKVASKVGLNTSRDDLCPDLPESTLYSRRMVRDEIKRIACSAAGTAGGGNPSLKNAVTFKDGSKGDPKGMPKRKGGSSSSSSSSDLILSVSPQDVKAQFETFRKVYPGRKRGLDVELAHLKTKYPDRWMAILPILLPAAMAYAAQCEREGTELRYRLHLKTWINGQGWTTEQPNPQGKTAATLPPEDDYVPDSLLEVAHG